MDFCVIFVWLFAVGLYFFWIILFIPEGIFRCRYCCIVIVEILLIGHSWWQEQNIILGSSINHDITCQSSSYISLGTTNRICNDLYGIKGYQYI